MRPLQLSFSGVRSYPAAFGPLDFTGKNLIAILGDTGAGKSTILEAITLALYGHCTWDSQQTRALMADGAAQMSVDLTFAHDGHRWQVRRVFHANTTPSTHHLKNLDTGEETDNGRAVNRRIEALLKLRFDSFRTAVLLPQGQFSRLLTATGTERTALLKDIFGIQIIETLHQHASLHRDRLSSVVNRGQLARKDLLDDPSATAAAADQRADQQERLAALLDKALGNLRATQKAASAAQARRAMLTNATAGLAQHEVRDAVGATQRIAAIAADLTAEDTRADNERKDQTDRQSQAAAELGRQAEDGLTPGTLASAATVLNALPARLDQLSAEQAQLDRDERAAGQEALDLDTAASDLQDLESRTAHLETARQTAATTLREFRDAFRRLQDRVDAALLDAAQFGEARHHEHQAAEQLRLRREALPPLESDATRTEAARLEADAQLSAVWGREAAHTAGAVLSPGDPCLICQRQLPGNYHPPAPADPQALADAEQAQETAARKERDAAKKLTQAQTDIRHADRSHQERRETTVLARDRLDQARQDATTAMRGLTQRPRAGAGPGSEEAFLAGLQAACTRLSEADARHDDLRASSADQLLQPARDLGQALEDAAAAASGSVTETRKDASAASVALERQQAAHEQAVARIAAGRSRHAQARGQLGRDAESLPVPIRQLLPADPLAAAPGHLTAARAAVRAGQQRLEDLSQAREDATAEITQIDKAQHQREIRRSREVTSPLQELTAELARWGEAIEQAAAAIGDGAASLPARPASITAADVSAYAAAVAETAARMWERVTAAAGHADDEARELLDELGAAAAALQAGQDSYPPVPLASGAELLTTAALDPVVAAHASAVGNGRRYRQEQAAASGQVDQAARLDTAIKAAEDRLAAVSALRAMLAPGKFPQYLTELRTKTLLGVASELFGQLSDGEFGFAADFQIITRRSGTTRSPRTLSGGETFLASLALALALVELHSRTGARLGSLFLDEGFGSLDVDTLATALTVLRAETGDGKLVAVISHLHAVAEAVEDVIWVERRPDGSMASWLSAGARDALVRQDVAGGLLNLA
jgi:DNA repair protein SbcC/Rad50